MVYTPPDAPDVLQRLLTDWEQYAHARDGDPLTRLARLHYQFVTIHPFLDGNGRTARILHTVLLREFQLLDQPVLYLSRSILRRRDAYYTRIQAVTEQNDWAGFETFMAEVTAEAATWTVERVEAVLALYSRTEAQLRSLGAKFADPRLIEVLFTQPYCRIEHVVQTGLAQKQTAARYLDRLVNAGILQSERLGRDKLDRFPGILSALEV